MTPTEPGRALDALVAEKVMGLAILGWDHAWRCEGEWVIDLGESGEKHPLYLRHCACDVPPNGDWPRLAGHTFHCLGVVSKFSTDIAAAWQVVDKLAASGKMACLTIDLLGGEGEEWRVFFQWDVSDDELAMPYADAPTAPLAICLAALRAVGHE